MIWSVIATELLCSKVDLFLEVLTFLAYFKKLVSGSEQGWHSLPTFREIHAESNTNFVPKSVQGSLPIVINASI